MITRQDYETKCENIGALTDETIKNMAYDLLNRDFSSVKDFSDAHRQKMSLARERLLSLSEKIIPQTPNAVQMIRCDCGHTIARSQIMSASLGTSCPDCYDQMS